MDNAVLMAIRLEAAGAKLKEVSECKTNVDGAVFINDLVSVHVATDGSFACTTKQEGDTFTFGPERAQTDIDALLADIAQAMK